MGHGRDQEDGHRALLLHHAQPAVGVEARLVDHLQAELHRRVHQGDAGEGEERAGVQPAGAGPVGLDGADHRPVGVAHGHALGPPGRPRGVEDVGQVLGLARRLEGRAVAGGGLVPAEHRDGPAVRRRRRRPPRRRRSGRRGGLPRPPGRCAAGRRRPPRPWRPSARACGPPRPGPGGGSSGTATPPARWTAEYETSQRSASSGCRWMPTRASGSRPASSRRRAMALAAPSHSAKVMDPTSTTAKAVGRRTPRPCGPGARPSTRCGSPRSSVGAES